MMRYVLTLPLVPDRGVDQLLWCLDGRTAGWASSRFQIGLQALYKQVGSLLPNVRDYAPSAHFVCAPFGLLRLQIRRKAHRG